MEPDFAGSARKELDYFLATFVTPILKAHGYRKSSHTYRKTVPNGDQVSIQFRGWAFPGWCTFFLIAAAMSEPEWDARHLESGKIYPAGKLKDDMWRIGAPGSQPTSAEPWSFSSIEQRRDLGSVLLDTLYADVLPYLDLFLDRDALLATIPRPDRDWRRLDGFEVSDKLRLALLAARGPSDELRQLMERMASEPKNQQILRWAAIRTHGGPTWADPASPP